MSETTDDLDPAVVERAAKAIRDKGAWCGVCDGPDDDTCRDCAEVCATYARAALAVARDWEAVDVETTTEWGVRRDTHQFGIVVDAVSSRQVALLAAQRLCDPGTVFYEPSAVAVSREVTTSSWREVSRG